MKNVALFDFDGTITRKDSFLKFILFSRGRLRSLLGFFLLSPLLLAWKMGIISNSKSKEMVFSFFFKGVSIIQFNFWCAGFLPVLKSIIRSDSLHLLQSHLEKKDIVVIVSASIKNWILPWAQEAGIDEVISTDVEVDENGILTGKFSSPNCSGQEKVNRVQYRFPQRDDFFFYAYGNSKSDKPMMRFADKCLFL